MTDETVDRWRDAQTALALLAVDPFGLGGVNFRARTGPARERWNGAAKQALAGLAQRRIAPEIADDQLFGGLDLAATLATGRPVIGDGLLHEADVVFLAMAERAGADLAAKLGAAIDCRALAVVALDEGLEPEESAPPALLERLAFHLAPGDVGLREATSFAPDCERIHAARHRLGAVAVADEAAAELVALAAMLGIASLRAPMLALRAARAAAALAGRMRLDADDLALAARLVLAPRATMLPADDQAAEPPENNETDKTDDAPPPEAETQRASALREMLLEAVSANLPPDLLDRLAAGSAAGPSRRGADGASIRGARRKGTRRGRPLPARRGRFDGRARIDLSATLRAAAPWQPLRRQATPAAGAGVLVRPDDIRLKRREERSDRLLVFAVDASGSTALARLAEAKGAVELLLAGAYSRRDHVALVAFRGDGAQLLLPPTRSLARAKRQLASLPGGGATPLAAGLQAAHGLVEGALRRGASPSLILLTDGRANIALDGGPGRDRAVEDAIQVARLLSERRTPSVVIDASPRPRAAAEAIAGALGGDYLPLPRADAHRLSAAVGASLDARR